MAHAIVAIASLPPAPVNEAIVWNKLQKLEDALFEQMLITADWHWQMLTAAVCWMMLQAWP